MEFFDKIAVHVWYFFLALLLIFRSEMIARFLIRAFRKFPHDKSALPDQQLTIRPKFIVIFGCLILILSLAGMYNGLIE